MKWKRSELLVDGRHQGDDCYVVQLKEGGLAAVSVDMISPLVDDPYVFGQIAAANSLSDVYAMGGRPRFAMSVLGFASDRISPVVMGQVLQGAVDKADEAGVVIAGGHTVSSQEVFFGLAVMGDVTSQTLIRKGGARPGDLIVLTKPIGTGILGAGLKRGLLEGEPLASWTHSLCTLNNTACEIAVQCGCKGGTDVTGFGLLGHLLEMVQASGCSARINMASIPVFSDVRAFLAMGLVPGGSKRNLAHVRDSVLFPRSMPVEDRLLLADAQTSGGLLLALNEGAWADFKRRMADRGAECWLIGYFEDGHPRITLM